MTVRDLLARTTSRELAEWVAYEHHAGPLGPAWRDDTAAATLEALQYIQHLLGAGLFSDRTHPNPVPAPSRVPRPAEAAEAAEADTDAQEQPAE
jgi:hypothetical protein